MDSYPVRISIPEDSIPLLTKECFNWLRLKFGFSKTIIDLPELVEAILELKLDRSEYIFDVTPQFVSYTIDLQRDFMADKEVDMVVFLQDIMNIFHLSKLERQTLEKKHPEERLWSIFLMTSCRDRRKFDI